MGGKEEEWIEEEEEGKDHLMEKKEEMKDQDHDQEEQGQKEDQIEKQNEDIDQEKLDRVHTHGDSNNESSNEFE